VKCIGWANKEAQIPLRVDHIFRVFSNTKLITSCVLHFSFSTKTTSNWMIRLSR
jgi:Beta-lactamase